MADNKPGGVTAIGVMALCLGIMGVLGGAVGIAGSFIPMQQQPAAGGNPRMAEIQAEFQQRLGRITLENRKTALIVFPCLMAVSVLLAAAGIAALQLKARTFVKVAFGVSLLADTLGAIYGIVVQMKTMELMRWYSAEISQVSNVPAMEMVMNVSTWIGVFFGAGWMIAKAAFYIVGLVYLGKPKVRQAFEGGAAPASQP
jgi:hypothetical protein